MRRQFDAIVDALIRALGSPRALVVAAAVVVVWGLSGPVFGFSDTWQLVINTGTTIVTFLMVFVIQNSQNRDSKAVHIKLDELLRAVDGARERFVLAEAETEDEQDREIAELKRLAGKAARRSGAAAAAARSAKETARDAAQEAGTKPGRARKPA